MNMIRIRLISLLMVSVIALSLFTGCSSRENKVASEFEGLNIEKLEPVTLTFCFPGSQAKADIQEVHSKVEEHARQLKIKLDFKWINYRDYINKLKSIAASGGDMDAFYIQNPTYYFPDFTAMARNNELKDITALFPTYAPHLFRMYSEDDLASVSVDGRIVAVPPVYPLALSNYVYVKPDIAAKYNIQEIKTFEDYENILQTIKSNEKGIYPASLEGYCIDLFARPFGYTVLDKNLELVYKQDDPDMKLYPWEQTDDFKKAAGYITSWQVKGYLADPALNVEYDKIATFLRYDAVNDEDSSNSTGMKAFQLYPEMKVYKADTMNDDYRGGAIAFNATSKNVERALMFLDWLNTDRDNYELFMYGIKGKHYIEKNDNIITLPDGIDINNSCYMYWNGYMSFFNINLDRQLGAEYAQKHLDYIKNITAYAPHEGFHADYTPVKTEAESRSMLLQRHIEMPLMYSFNYNMEQTDMTIDVFKNNGSDKIVQEVQRQLDKWKTGIKK